MEENNNIENKEKKQHICFKDHCWKMCLGMVVAAFLGGFLATYFVADQMMERCQRKYFMPPKFGQNDFREFDKNFDYNMKYIDKIMKKQAHHLKDNEFSSFSTDTMFAFEPVKITSFFDDENLNIEVSLKQFQGDESKVNYNIVGSKLTVFGKSKVKNDKNEEYISFSHDFILPDNADTMNIKKEKAGDTLIISVPLKEGLKD